MLSHRTAGLILAAALSSGAVEAQDGLTTFDQDGFTPFEQALAKVVSDDPAVAKFYRGGGYEAIWTDTEPDDRGRLAALIAAFERADAHALPARRFSAQDIRDSLSSREPHSARKFGVVISWNPAGTGCS
jgi:hypothetical protein